MKVPIIGRKEKGRHSHKDEAETEMMLPYTTLLKPGGTKANIQGLPPECQKEHALILDFCYLEFCELLL